MFEGITVNEVAATILHFRNTEAFKRAGQPGMHKVSFLFDSQTMLKVDKLEGTAAMSKLKAIMLKVMVSEGGQRKVGPPPKGELERVLQRRLRQLQQLREA